MMTRDTYEYIQERLTQKLYKPKPWDLGGKREEAAYEQGFYAAKSIIKEIYEDELRRNHK